MTSHPNCPFSLRRLADDWKIPSKPSTCGPHVFLLFFFLFSTKKISMKLRKGRWSEKGTSQPLLHREFYNKHEKCCFIRCKAHCSLVFCNFRPKVFSIKSKKGETNFRAWRHAQVEVEMKISFQRLERREEKCVRENSSATGSIFFFFSGWFLANLMWRKKRKMKKNLTHLSK